MAENRVAKDSLWADLPPEWPVDLRPEIQRRLQTSRTKVVVLDDDPTGTQTVHGIPVLTEWPVAALKHELENDLLAFYLLTNSRSMSLTAAQALNKEIGRNLMAAVQQVGRDFVVVSRSDSTLRGHFPGEVEVLADAMGQKFDGWLLIPFFLEGGRTTINDIHYVAEGDWLVPAGETEFARDAAFGYRASNLRQWVAEKTGGRIPAETVASISLEDIRLGGPERVTARLMELNEGRVCVVNAASMRDLEVFTLGLLAAEAGGKQFLYRTAASFVQVRAGLTSRPLLQLTDLNLPISGGGLIVVGSYVPKTSSQVTELLAQPDIVSLEVEVEALLDDIRQLSEIERVVGQANQALSQSRDVVIFTSRQLIAGSDAESSLAIGQRISANLVAIVKAVSVRPRYVLAKGGITSSDVATQGLAVKRALVLGQILPGVPVWQLGPESHYPGLIYVVFPGNVGGPQDLAEVVTKLKGN